MGDMLQRTPASVHLSWQQALAQAITDPAQLLHLLNLADNEALLRQAFISSKTFGLKVPLGYIARMRKGDPKDPLLLQVLPLAEEQDDVAGFDFDPVGDLTAAKTPGLLHKYAGRVLLTVTGECAIHCRYCFRRHFPYDTHVTVRQEQMQTALDYIAAHNDITEVILSGGDPLSLSDRRLQYIVEQCAAITHVQRLRIHTRTPVILPERITSSFVAALTSSRLHPVIVLHINHPQELDSIVITALLALKNAGVLLLNQSVLLKGINDDVEILSHLSQQLFNAGVLPYYLHLLDRVQGAAHFEVDETRARQIYTRLQNKLPGYLVPRLAREQQGKTHKVLLTGSD